MLNLDTSCMDACFLLNWSMKYKQEYIAENLYSNLQTHFKDSKEPVKISKQGAGVHWNCTVDANNRECKIHCFDTYGNKDNSTEYLIAFQEAAKHKMWGRTRNLNETLNSIEDWLNEKTIEWLYEKYEFLDWSKRRILFIEKQLIKHEPELKKVENSFYSPWGSGLYDYSISYNNRSCILDGYGKHEPTSFHFCWDNCRLFEVKQNDLTLMAKAVKMWLIEEIVPSQLEAQLKWIKISELALYYEKGEGIKGEFIESWNSIERFYKRIDENFTPKVLQLIKEMREHGFDKKLRAGQSLYTLMLSRSRRHGLTWEQNFLAFRFYIDKNEMKVTDKSDTLLLNGKVEYSNELENLLNELAEEAIS